MVDVLRAYRRWLVGRLALLVPAFSTALAANVWIALDTGLERWLKVISLVLSGLSLSTLGYLLAETLLCAGLQREGRRGLARALRGQLALSSRVAAVCLFAVLILVGVPFVLREPAERPSTTRARRPRPEPPPEVVEFTQVVALAAPDEPPPPKPQIQPIVEDLPTRLLVDETEIEAPLALLQEPPPAKVVEEEAAPEALRFQPEIRGPEAAALGVERLGLPEDVDVLPPSTTRVALLLVSMEGAGRGAGVDVEADYVVSQAGSLRASYLGVVFGRGQEMEELASDWTWHRLTLGYQHRLLGYTRRAPFDLAVFAGATLDRFGCEGLDETARVSPYAALELGLFQGGSWGFTLRAGHGIPFNLTGASSSVSDVAGSFRVDLSEKLSLFAGYRFLIARLKEYPEALRREHGEEEFAGRLSGPLLGVEYRF